MVSYLEEKGGLNGIIREMLQKRGVTVNSLKEIPGKAVSYACNKPRQVVGNYMQQTSMETARILAETLIQQGIVLIPEKIPDRTYSGQAKTTEVEGSDKKQEVK